MGCLGSESRLVDCPSNGIGIHNCVHSEDASVRCLPADVTTPPRMLCLNPRLTCIIYYFFVQLFVPKETFDWLEVVIVWKDVLNCAITMPGVQYVMIFLEPLMQMLLADNLDYQEPVY